MGLFTSGSEDEMIHAAILKTALDGFWIVDATDGRLLEVNDAYCRMVGWTREEILGRSLSDFEVCDAGESSPLQTTAIVRHGSDRFETRHRRKDSGIIDVEVSVQYLNARPPRIFAFIRNITRQKRWAQALWESEERLKLALSAGNHGLYDFDFKTGRTIVNGPYAAMLGHDPYTFEESHERFVRELHPEDRKPVFRSFRAYIKGERPEYRVEFRRRTASGAWKWILSTGMVVTWDDQGNPIRMLGTHTDIDPRKQIETQLVKTLKELERSNTELEQFAYVASHDLQEPLRMVSSFTQLLAKRYGDKLDQDARDFIGFAVDGANRMQRLIQDLLWYSRVTTQAKPLQAIDADAALDAALANLRLSIEESHAEIIREKLPAVTADPTQLVQIFQNLVANALKFRKPDTPPRIQILGRKEGETWTFSVADNGIGIDSKYFDRIFTLFQRLHHRREYPGSGIGLSICKRIVERHGGRIWVVSKVGVETTFYFTLKE